MEKGTGWRTGQDDTRDAYSQFLIKAMLGLYEAGHFSSHPGKVGSFLKQTESRLKQYKNLQILLCLQTILK